jgi:hypothetical protein
LIKGVICGVRVEDIQDPNMREIRYLDKLVDELAKAKAMDKILNLSLKPMPAGDTCSQIRTLVARRHRSPHR